MKFIGKEYEGYLKSSPEDRRAMFDLVFFQLRRASERERVTGNQSLEVLGRPDLWLQVMNGEVILVYFYTPEAGPKMEAIIVVGPDGFATYFGFNRVGVNSFGPSYHRERHPLTIATDP